jgi:hypothetical protein
MYLVLRKGDATRWQQKNYSHKNGYFLSVYPGFGPGLRNKSGGDVVVKLLEENLCLPNFQATSWDPVQVGFVCQQIFATANSGYRFDSEEVRTHYVFEF